MPEIKLKFEDTADGQVLTPDDDIASTYTLGRQVAHEYHSSAVQSYIEAETAAQQVQQQAAMSEMDQFKKEQAKKKAEETGKADEFAATMVESLATRKPEATSSFGKAGEKVGPEGGGGGWGDETAPEAMPSESKKIQSETSSQVEDPMIDPVLAASAGAGSAFKLSMSAGKALMPSFAAAARAGLVNAAMEPAYGTAAEVVGANNPALALPFNVLAGIGGGMAFEPMLERAISRASSKIGKAIDPAMMKSILANESGAVNIYKNADFSSAEQNLRDTVFTTPGKKSAVEYGISKIINEHVSEFEPGKVVEELKLLRNDPEMLSDQIQAVFGDSKKLVREGIADEKFDGWVKEQIPKAQELIDEKISEYRSGLNNLKKRYGIKLNESGEVDDLTTKGTVGTSVKARGIKGDAYLNSLDLYDDLAEKGAEISKGGLVTLYHRTTPENAQKIAKTGIMTGKEDRLFFGTHPEGQIEGYGEGVVRVQIPIEKLELNDVFTNEAHVTVKGSKANLKAEIWNKPQQIDDLTKSAVVEELNNEIKQLSVADILKSQKGELVVRQGDEVVKPDLISKMPEQQRTEAVQNSAFASGAKPIEVPKPDQTFVKNVIAKQPDSAKLFSFAPGAGAGFEQDEQGNITFDPEKAIAGMAAMGAAAYGVSRFGIEKRGKGDRYLRGGKVKKVQTIEDLQPVINKTVDAKSINPAWDQVKSVDEAIEYSKSMTYLEPEVVNDLQSLRWRKNDEGYYGNGKMGFGNDAYPLGRNTWDINGCGREAWANQNGIDVKQACYGGACYAEVQAKSKGQGSTASGERFTVVSSKDIKRAEIESFYKKNGPEATRNKYPDYAVRYYAAGELGKDSVEKISVKLQTAEGGRPARVTTNIQPANGQDIRLGVDTDGAAWLSKPEVMDAIVAANPRTLTVYSAGYHTPPPPHPLSERTIINVTVSGWHPLPETMSRLRWAQEARQNGWNVILREVTADPAAFEGGIVAQYNRLHNALIKSDFFVMEQPLHQGRTSGGPVKGLPGCCKGSKANPHTCDNCEVAEGLGKGFQRFWNVVEEGGSEKVLPGVPDYKGNKLSSPFKVLSNQKGEIVISGGNEPTLQPAPVKGGSKKSGVPAPPDMKAKSAEVLANTNPDITQEYAGNIRLWGGADLEPKFLGQIETPEDIMRVISGTDEAFKAEREVARRGTRSWEDTEAEAKKYRIEDLLGRRSGQAFNAEQIDNARTLLVSSSETLRGMSRVIQAGTATDIEKMDFMRAFNTHYAIQMQVSGAAAEAGRALNIFRKVAQSDAIKMGQIREFMQGSAGKVAPEMLAKAISEMETPAQVSNFVKQATKATSWDMFIEAWINGLLSGPVTHAVNMTSNALTSMWMIPERALASGISLLGRGEIRGGEVAAQSFGLVQGFKDGLNLAWEALKKGESSDLMGKIENQTNRAITAENVRQLPLISKLAPNALEEGGIAARAVDMLGEGIRIPGRMLTAADELFKSVGYRMELQAQAYRKAAGEGLEGAAMATRIREIVSNPQELAPEVHLASINAARYQTFTSELGEGGRAVQVAANKVPGVKLIVPFIRTPTNILKFAMERTPLAPMMKSVRADILAGGARRDMALARISLGSMAMAVTASYAADGTITGGGPSDPALKSHLYNQGWQPYSIKVNGKYYGYGRLEPIGMMMGLAADAVEIMGEVDELEGSKIASTVVSAIAKNVTSKTWLRGLSEFVAAMDDPDRYGDKYIQQFIGTAVPTGVAQIERTISPEVSDVQGWMDKLKSRIPGYSDELPTRRNLWGEKITFNGSLGPDIVSPIFTSSEKDSKIDKELIRMKTPIRMPQRKQSIQGVTVPLDGYEYEEFVVRMNNIKIESTGKTLKKSLDYLVTKDKDYKSARDDDQRERMIKAYMNEAIDKTRNEMYETNTEIRRFVDDEHRRMAAVQ